MGELIADIIGIIGVMMIVFSFFLLQAGKSESNGWDYLLLNLIGAVFLLYSLLWFWNTASVVIEIFWIGISLFGICRKLRKKNS